MVTGITSKSNCEDSKMIQDSKNISVEIFNSAVTAVLPQHLIRNRLKYNDGYLDVMGKKFDLYDFTDIYVIGGGKASGLMALALEEILGERIKGGCVAVKEHKGIKPKAIEIVEASHPIPDERSLAAAKKIEDVAKNANLDSIVIALISGGASALLCAPVHPLTLTDKQEVTRILMKSGATIHEINTIRKHLSEIKGGQLAKKTYPATLISLIISDVVGDDLGFISSGPTVPDITTFSDCIEIVKKYNLNKLLPQIVMEHLKKGASGEILETPKSSDSIFYKTFNFLIGNNQFAATEAVKKAESLGFNAFILTTLLQGESKDVAKVLVSIAKEIKKNDQPFKKPACIIAAGESTVTINGEGKGGRNQEIALAAAIELEKEDGITFLSAGTDGIDGFTDAAGAISDSRTSLRGKSMGLSATEFLKNHDSYNYFKPLGDLIITGSTFTNVMDIQVILIQ
jgi:glycerate 2-kinase